MFTSGDVLLLINSGPLATSSLGVVEVGKSPLVLAKTSAIVVSESVFFNIRYLVFVELCW